MGGSIAQFAALMRKLYQIYQFSYQLSTNIMWIYWITHLIWHDFILITTYNPSKKVKKKEMLFHDKAGIFQRSSRGTPFSSLFWRETWLFLLFTNKEKNVHYNLLLSRLVDLHGAAPSTLFEWLFNKGQIWRFGEKIYIYSE